MKILITNIVSLNPGDAAILQGTFKILRQRYGQDITITVYDRRAEAAKRYYPWAKFRQSLYPCTTSTGFSRFLQRNGYGHWVDRIRYVGHLTALLLIKARMIWAAKRILAASDLKTLLDYHSADLILSTGGTYLIENYDLIAPLRDYQLAKISGTPYGFFTQTLGPFRNRQNIAAFTPIFNRAAVILVRDDKSLRHIEELGVPTQRIHICADAAFVLAESTRAGGPSQVPARRSTEPMSRPLRLAISVRELKFFQESSARNYYACVAQMAEHAVGKFNATVTFLSTCQGIAEYWTDDSATAEKVAAQIPPGAARGVSIDPQFRSPDEVVSAYRDFDAVIATRMHAAILSLCAGTPTACIAYEFKMEELYQNIEMPELCLPVSDMTPVQARQLVDKLLENIAFYSEKASTASAEMSSSAWRAAEFLPSLQ